MCYTIITDADGLKRESEKVMKKVALLILSITILICLVACNQGQNQNPTPEHTHSFGEWDVTKNATCTEDGVKVRYCDCGEKQSESIPTLNHTEVIDEAVAPTCTEAGKTEGKHCPYCNTVFVVQEVIPTVDHVYNTTYSFDNSFHWYACKNCGAKKDANEHQEADNGMCSVCDQSVGPTVGIIYDISADGTYAMVVGYEGSATKIKIADTYEGLPVKVIYSSAFYENRTITSVIIPNSVTSIGERAFYSCSNLTSVVIGDNVTSIGDHAFFKCTGLTSVVIGDSVTSIGEYAFYECKSLASVLIPDGVTYIGYAAFYGCDSLSSIVIPDSVTYIREWAFSGCDSLTSVVIGDSVTYIGYAAFYDCYSLTDVYYKGSEEEWQKVIIVDEWNYALGNAQIHYNYVPEN